MKIHELLLCGTEILKENGIETAVLDSQVLLMKYLGCSKTFLITNKYTDLEEYEGYFDYIYRRAKHEPVAYITGNAEFMSLDFIVNKSTLIPRPDTETLVEKTIEHIKNGHKKIIDIGCGSGCIGISVLKNCKHTKCTGIDISEEALETAEANSEKNGVQKRYTTIKMDILSEIPKDKYDILLSNPPYIRNDIIPTLMPDVKDFEPKTALIGGDDGLIFYRRISEIAKLILNKKYFMALEIGYDQAEAVTQILQKDGYENIKVLKDLSGNDRVVTVCK